VPVEHSCRLLCHPATPSLPVAVLSARARRGPAVLELGFCLEGDLSRLRIPAGGPARRGVDLWRHTCFEAFIARDGDGAYHEVNLSPSCEWAAYAFRAYRDGSPLADESLAPEIAVRRSGDRLEVVAALRLERLSSAHAQAPLRLGLSAVVEASDGTLSYWALRHPRSKPDFHDAAAFTLRLERAGAGC